MESMKRFFITATFVAAMMGGYAETVTVGSGSYTTTHPGYDQAGRNGFPTANPLVSGEAATRPVPSNKWWSQKLTTASPENLFNYPLGLQTDPNGLGIVRNPQEGAITAQRVLVVGVEGVMQDVPTVCDYSDWTVTFAWENAFGRMTATAGTGMPMVYFTKQSDAAVSVSYSGGRCEVRGNIAVLTGCFNEASYAIYAPSGSTWSQTAGKLTSTLNGLDYWTVALLPDRCADAMAQAQAWASHAFTFPADTRAEWSYDETTGRVTTTYTVVPDHKEGSGTALMGLLPHQWAHLDGTPEWEAAGYSTVRGELKMLAADSFTTSLTFHGVLPTMPVVTVNDNGYSDEQLRALVDQVTADHGLAAWTDSYNDGQLLNRLVQTARIAHDAGYTEGFEKARELVRARVENWLTYTSGEKEFLFYYYKPWGTLLGYPAGHGQDTNLNDHHFHWGYIIHAAAFLAQYDPQWGDAYAPMIDLLVRDAASTDRDDPMFPYQRAFSPYDGHCWANGTASIGQGNDQESTSEAMQFHTSLIHWGAVRGNRKVRDLGIYMYVTEQSATEEYWFDMYDRNLPSDYRYFIVSRVFTNGYDSENFWGGGIAGSYGIQIYPVHAGSFYLVDNRNWAKRFWEAITTDTDILRKVKNPNIWYDSYWQFLSMINPAKALNLYNDYPDRELKFGISQAQTYQWLHSMMQYGRPDRKITANYPLATAFRTAETVTYVAHNYATAPITVRYSDGFELQVPAGSMATASAPNTEEFEDDDDPGVTPPDPNPDPDPDPGKPGDGFVFTSQQASQGEFAGPYTIRYGMSGNDVWITADFAGDYVGLGNVAYIWNETSGFAEIAMSKTSESGYSGKITGVTTGSTVRFRIKVEFAGGMAVTEQVEYIVGTTSGLTAIDRSSAADAPAEYFDMQGRRIAEPSSPGIYICRRGSKTMKIRIY